MLLEDEATQGTGSGEGKFAAVVVSGWGRA
jgi:hypothetical protein